MPLDPDFPPAAAASSTEAMLRQRAERRLPAPAEPSQPTLQATIHALRVHQIELEMQNEELRRTQLALAASQATYFDFYDLAPVGYCTVSAGGLILQTNLTAAANSLSDQAQRLVDAVKVFSI